MKYFRRKKKNWEELTIEEKLNVLKMNYDYPSFMSTFIFIFVAISIFALIFVIFLFNNVLMGDMINQSIYLPSNATYKTWSNLDHAGNIFTLYLMIIILIMFTIDVLSFLRYSHHWGPFKHSIYKKKEVIY